MRKATELDFEEIVRMGRLFANEVNIEFDERTVLKTANQLIETPDGIILIDKGGMAGALAYPLFLNDSIKVAQELFWWVDTGRRGGMMAKKLLNGLEDWAISVNASQLMMISMDSSPDFVDRFYERSGYSKRETTFMKVL